MRLRRFTTYLEFATNAVQRIGDESHCDRPWFEPLVVVDPR